MLSFRAEPSRTSSKGRFQIFFPQPSIAEQMRRVTRNNFLFYISLILPWLSGEAAAYGFFEATTTSQRLEYILRLHDLVVKRLGHITCPRCLYPSYLLLLFCCMSRLYHAFRTYIATMVVCTDTLNLRSKEIFLPQRTTAQNHSYYCHESLGVKEAVTITLLVNHLKTRGRKLYEITMFRVAQLFLNNPSICFLKEY